jgi:putative phosphoesterase
MNPANKEFTIGVISDTHGLLRPEAVPALLGSDLILHAGDIGTPQIIPTLRRIAPVVAVRGNIDSAAGEWTREFPPTNVAEAAGLHLYMLHDLKQLDLNPSAAGFAAVISGHSHQPRFYFENDVQGNAVLYFNPGSAGPRRFSLPISVGRIVVRDGKLWPEIIELQIK